MNRDVPRNVCKEHYLVSAENPQTRPGDANRQVQIESKCSSSGVSALTCLWSVVEGMCLCDCMEIDFRVTGDFERPLGGSFMDLSRRNCAWLRHRLQR